MGRAQPVNAAVIGERPPDCPVRLRASSGEQTEHGKPFDSLDRGLGEAFRLSNRPPRKEQVFEYQMTPLRGKFSPAQIRFIEASRGGPAAAGGAATAPVGLSTLRGR
jgi:hypothetical protein